MDARVAELAQRQDGRVHRDQLRALGLGDGAVESRLRAGRLHPEHHGVYVVGYPHDSRRARWVAALLAAGPGAALTHRSAGALHGVCTEAAGPVHVVVPSRAGRSRPDVRFSRPRTLRPDELTVVDDLPVTTVARTLIDLAGVLPLRRLVSAVEASDGLRVFDLRDLERVMAAHPGARGVRRLRTALEQVAITGVVPVRSGLERWFYELCDGRGLPRPLVNVDVGAGFEVDFAWPAARLVVEVDHSRWHGTSAARERDTRRDAALAVIGWASLRYTERRIADEPAQVLDEVHRVLTRRLAEHRGSRNRF